MSTVTLTKDNFQTEVMESELPVIVDLWAPWCGPCRQVAPVLDDIAGAYVGRLVVGKVNVDEEPELAAAFGVRGIPTIVLMKGGEAVSAMTGAGPRPVVEQQLKLDEHVAPAGVDA
jgi:thioredoxin 1